MASKTILEVRLKPRLTLLPFGLTFKVNYCHSTLGSKVLIERLPGIKHYAGITLGGDTANCLQCMYANTENDIGSADLMLYMGFIGPNYSSGGGIAYLATVCEGDSYRKLEIKPCGLKFQNSRCLFLEL